MNIFLIGYRCTGKTAVGKALSNALGWEVVDADTELVNEQGSTITEIVADQGWEAFREMETSVLKKVCSRDNQVVSTGGGVVLDNENVRTMKKNGFSVWLQASSETIRQRIVKDQKTAEQRPSLTPQGLLEEIDGVLTERTPLYKDAMDFYVDTDNISIDQVCEKILAKLHDISAI